MTVTINGTTGITNDGGYTGDGVVFADTTPANTLVTTTGGNVGIGTSSPNSYGGQTALTINGSSYSRVDFNTGGTKRTSIYSESASNLIFETANTERARIDSSGNLLVGKTAANVSSTGWELSPNGGAQTVTITGSNQAFVYNNTSTAGTATIAFRTANVERGNIAWTNSATSYNTSSDYRLKENILPMTGALAKVAALKPCTYKWKADGSDGEGFIAHELQAVVPQCVTGEKDAVDAEGNPQYQGIDTSFLVATLTAAIQEQQALIASQSAIITALTARVEALEGTQP